MEDQGVSPGERSADAQERSPSTLAGQGLERRIAFFPSYDKRSPVASENYGVSAMRLVFYVIGPKGAVQWMIGTNWYVDSAAKHLLGFPSTSMDRDRRPKGYDLGYHSHEPHYEGQSAMNGDCDVIGGNCFYDGSSLNAELPIEGFLAGGEDYLWPKLEAFYRSTFEDGEWPFRSEATDARARGAYF